MKEKKDRERFSIKFNKNDPAHDAVIRLLEKQGSHSKAQFIPASNEPSDRACTDSWRMPRGSNTIASYGRIALGALQG